MAHPQLSRLLEEPIKWCGWLVIKVDLDRPRKLSLFVCHNFHEGMTQYSGRMRTHCRNLLLSLLAFKRVIRIQKGHISGARMAERQLYRATYATVLPVRVLKQPNAAIPRTDCAHDIG